MTDGIMPPPAAGVLAFVQSTRDSARETATTQPSYAAAHVTGGGIHAAEPLFRNGLRFNPKFCHA